MESPQFYKKFEEGHWFIRRKDKYWGGIPSDQTIEQLLMCALKTRGGLSRGRGFTEAQQAVWLYSRNICVEVNLSFLNGLVDINRAMSEQHVVLGKYIHGKMKMIMSILS